jgi:hypothetical protein
VRGFSDICATSRLYLPTPATDGAGSGADHATDLGLDGDQEIPVERPVAHRRVREVVVGGRNGERRNPEFVIQVLGAQADIQLVRGPPAQGASHAGPLLIAHLLPGQGVGVKPIAAPRHTTDPGTYRISDGAADASLKLLGPFVADLRTNAALQLIAWRDSHEIDRTGKSRPAVEAYLWTLDDFNTLKIEKAGVDQQRPTSRTASSLGRDIDSVLKYGDVGATTRR